MLAMDPFIVLRLRRDRVASHLNQDGKLSGSLDFMFILCGFKADAE